MSWVREREIEHSSRLSTDFATPAVRDAIHAQGAESLAMNSEQFAALLKSDCENWKDILARSGAKVQ